MVRNYFLPIRPYSLPTALGLGSLICSRSRQISFASFPYGGSSVTPFAYQLNITTRNLTKKTNSDLVWEPILAFIPPTLLIKSIADLGSNSAADTASGIRFTEAYSYCTLENSCDPDFSLGRCWGWCVALLVSEGRAAFSAFNCIA